MVKQNREEKPWYRQFWPWFLIALPTTVVIAAVGTAILAFNSADTLVNDNYYKDGLAINRLLELDEEATRLGLSANISIDKTTGELFVTLSGELTEQQPLELLLLHPVDESRDRTLKLTQVSPNRYRTDMDSQLNQRYYLRLQPLSGSGWRLNGELNFGKSDGVILHHNG
jgi:hypothetical protein